MAARSYGVGRSESGCSFPSHPNGNKICRARVLLEAIIACKRDRVTFGASKHSRSGAMKAIVSVFALGSALMVASMSFAADAPSQPLTRSDCDKAGMRWSEEANVCAEPNLTAAMPQSSTAFAADIGSQPLTRADCDKAGMRWNEAANVCAGASSQPLTRADCDRASMRWNEGANVCLDSTSAIGQ